MLLSSIKLGLSLLQLLTSLACLTLEPVQLLLQIDLGKSQQKLIPVKMQDRKYDRALGGREGVVLASGACEVGLLHGTHPATSHLVAISTKLNGQGRTMAS